MTAYRGVLLCSLLIPFLLYPSPTNTKAEEERDATPGRKAINRRIEGLKVYLAEDKTTPLQVHEIPPQGRQSTGTVDGGVFAFVMGTDPEGLLLIEARGAKDEYRWEYSLEKRTAWPVSVFLDEQLVVTLPRSNGERDQDFTWWVNEKYEPAK